MPRAETNEVQAEAGTVGAKGVEPKPSPYYADGPVSKEAYLAAAEKAGWNPEFLEENNFYPAISTKKHGEK